MKGRDDREWRWPKKRWPRRRRAGTLIALLKLYERSQGIESGVLLPGALRAEKNVGGMRGVCVCVL